MTCACCGIGHLLRVGEVLVGPLQIDGVQARRNRAVGRAGAIDLFLQLAVRSLHHARVQRILGLESFRSARVTPG